MAIYHFSAQIIGRSKGQSAIAAAAYRSGERLKDERTGETKYYPSDAGRILFTDIMAPPDAPEWVHDRNALWNAVEKSERRKDAQLAREIEVSLPHELTQQQREWLVKDFVREAFVRQGYVVDIAIHAPYEDADDRNFHAHLMITRRTVGPEGLSPKKDWQLDRDRLPREREQWANLANRHLERHGYDERIDHRTLAAQGTDREPTIHLGYAAKEMEQRGAQSDRMQDLAGILERNELRFAIREIDEELSRYERGDRPGASGITDWTDRGGMAAQQDAALEANRRLNSFFETPAGKANEEDLAQLRRLIENERDEAAKRDQEDRDLDPNGWDTSR